MLTIDIKLEGGLADLPPRSWLDQPIQPGGPGHLIRKLAAPTTVKDLLEAVGIPHCEIGTVRADEKHLTLDDLLTGDLTLDVLPTAPHEPEEPRFICDQHLGTLARLLRMMGLDTGWNPDWLEPEITRRALNEQRVVLSRSRSLLKRKALQQAMLIRSDQPDTQAGEVLRRFLLNRHIELFNRCTACNGQIDPVPKEKVRDRIPPRTRLWLDDYFLCRDCGRLYWEGTHVTAIRRRLDRIILQAAPPAE